MATIVGDHRFLVIISQSSHRLSSGMNHYIITIKLTIHGEMPDFNNNLIHPHLMANHQRLTVTQVIWSIKFGSAITFQANGLTFSPLKTTAVCCACQRLRGRATPLQLN